MVLTELLSAVRQLDHADKLRVMQFLVFELAREENALLEPGKAYPVWSPYDSFEAAHTLAKALKKTECPSHA
jgi:hypothetical protein